MDGESDVTIEGGDLSMVHTVVKILTARPQMPYDGKTSVGVRPVGSGNVVASQSVCTVRTLIPGNG